jgi:hypothetical protein
MRVASTGSAVRVADGAAPADESLLEGLQRAAFGYFMEAVNPAQAVRFLAHQESTSFKLLAAFMPSTTIIASETNLPASSNLSGRAKFLKDLRASACS